MKGNFLWKHLIASFVFIFIFGCIASIAQQAHIGPNNYATIQLAINAASDGDLITLDAGTFNENVVVNKGVIIQGAGEANTFIKPAISNPNCGGFGGGSLCAGGSNVILVQANNITIEQLTVDGDNPSLTSGEVVGGADIDARNGIITDHNTGTYNNLNVNHVTVKNVYLRGIYASSGGTFDFEQNTVSNVQGSTSSVALFNFGGSGTFTGNSVSSSNDGISSNWSTGTVYKSNTVTTSGSGIHTDNNGGDGGTADLIQNNTVTNSTAGGYGIWVFAPYVAPTVDGNTISNVDVGLANAGQFNPVTPMFTNNMVDGMNKPNATGVYQTTDQFGNGTNNVSGIYLNNFIKNTTDGFYLEFEAGNTNTITANYNSITGNTNNVTNGTGSSGAGTLINSFTCNWWGTNDGGLIASKVSAGTNYIPWLTNGMDNSAATGFQPSGSCNGYGYVVCDPKNGKDKKEDKILMCHNGKPECVNEKDVSKKLGENGWSLGPCNQTLCKSGETLMCHDGQSECVKDKDADKKEHEKGDHWVRGACTNGSFAIHNTEPEVELYTYPNPTPGKFSISLNDFKTQKVQLELSQYGGQVIERRTIQVFGKGQNESFDLSAKIAGIYILKVISEQGVKTVKVVVAH